MKPSYPARRRFADYFQQNFYRATSGNFRTQTLIDAILEIGGDRLKIDRLSARKLSRSDDANPRTGDIS